MAFELKLSTKCSSGAYVIRMKKELRFWTILALFRTFVQLSASSDRCPPKKNCPTIIWNVVQIYSYH